MMSSMQLFFLLLFIFSIECLRNSKNYIPLINYEAQMNNAMINELIAMYVDGGGKDPSYFEDSQDAGVSMGELCGDCFLYMAFFTKYNLSLLCDCR